MNDVVGPPFPWAPQGGARPSREHRSYSCCRSLRSLPLSCLLSGNETTCDAGGDQGGYEALSSPSTSPGKHPLQASYEGGAARRQCACEMMSARNAAHESGKCNPILSRRRWLIVACGGDWHRVPRPSSPFFVLLHCRQPGADRTLAPDYSIMQASDAAPAALGLNS